MTMRRELHLRLKIWLLNARQCTYKWLLIQYNCTQCCAEVDLSVLVEELLAAGANAIASTGHAL